MAQGKSPRNPLAFASVLYPGRCLASQPTGSGGERAVESQNHGPWPMILAVLCRELFGPAPPPHGGKWLCGSMLF